MKKEPRVTTTRMVHCTIRMRKARMIIGRRGEKRKAEIRRNGILLCVESTVVSLNYLLPPSVYAKYVKDSIVYRTRWLSSWWCLLRQSRDLDLTFTEGKSIKEQVQVPGKFTLFALNYHILKMFRLLSTSGRFRQPDDDDRAPAFLISPAKTRCLQNK